MDNRLISVQSEGREAFDLAFQLLFEDEKATHYLEHPEKGLIFLWHPEKDSIKLPYAMYWRAAADLAWGWLQERGDEEYREFCDHDGSDGHGFRVYNESWNSVVSSYGILAVLPVWAWYGK